MPSTAAIFRAARPVLRNRSPFLTQQYTNAFARQTVRAGRRFQTTGVPTEGVADAAAIQKSWLATFWSSPVGPKTVHFWAPVMKWCIVLAGIADFYRPAEKLSLTQNAALTATGAIWTRWCLIIKPKNYLLATVNFFLGCVGVIQVSRILAYQRSVKGQTPAEKIEAVKDEAFSAVEGIKDKVEGAVSK